MTNWKNFLVNCILKSQIAQCCLSCSLVSVKSVGGFRCSFENRSALKYLITLIYTHRCMLSVRDSNDLTEGVSLYLLICTERQRFITFVFKFTTTWHSSNFYISGYYQLIEMPSKYWTFNQNFLPENVSFSSNPTYEVMEYPVKYMVFPCALL